MSSTIRIACPAGEHHGIRVTHGTHVADIPVGGVQTFQLHAGKPLTITTLEEAPSGEADSGEAAEDAGE